MKPKSLYLCMAVISIAMAGCKENKAVEHQVPSSKSTSEAGSTPSSADKAMEPAVAKQTQSADTWSGKLELSKIATPYVDAASPMPEPKKAQSITIYSKNDEEPQRPSNPSPQNRESNTKDAGAERTRQAINAACDPSRFREITSYMSLGEAVEAKFINKNIAAQCNLAQQMR